MSDVSQETAASPTDQAMSEDATVRARAAAEGAAKLEAETLAAAAAAKAKAAAEAKALSEGLHAEIATIAAELDRLKSRLAEAAEKVATDSSFHGYASSFVNDVRHKVAEIHSWISRHLGE